MKKFSIIIFSLMLLAAIVVNPAAANSVNCNEPASKIFNRAAQSVVLITAVSLNPFSLQNRISVSMGSGFIIRKDGLILTNSHVVFGKQAISVSMADNQVFQARLIGADPIMDLAVLKIDTENALPELSLVVDKLPDVGDDVLAVGNPMGFERTLTRGIVSGVDRVLPISPMSMTIPMIQTDAAINPGNSGGPLLNMCGGVVGINTSVLLDAENMGFALPATIVNEVLPQLLKNGRIIRPWIGIRGQLIKKEELGSIFNFNLKSGFLVEMVETGSPAEKEGLLGGSLPIKIAGEDFLFGGDIITAINKKSLNQQEVYVEFLQNLKVGDTVDLTIFRENQTKKISLVVKDRPLLPWDLPQADCHMAIQ
ncbi:MAG: trypsin-like peptidase domain-containing protein [Desulfobacula sp.]|jgi:serine protease Do|nr:trypsin-like peptidase domain-containing protein [Desulfobacula sp.]